MNTIRTLVQGRVVLLHKIPSNLIILGHVRGLAVLLIGLSRDGSLVVVWWRGTGGIGGKVLRIRLLKVTSIGSR